MNTSSRLSETAISAAASARPKAPRGWLLAALAVIALGSSAWASGPPVSFVPAQTVSGPGTGGQIKLIDLNNDGKLDAVVGTLNSTFVTYLGNGNATFAAPVSTTVTAVSGTAVSIAVGDINGDGKPDVVTTTVENILRVFLGNGDGTFTASSTYPTGSNPSSIVIGDFNRDGFMDVAVGNYDSGTIRLLQGTAAPAGGLFPVADQLDLNTPGAPVVIGAMDFNGDGFTDLAWSTSSGLGFLYDSRLPRPTGFLTHAFSQRGGVAAGILTPGAIPTVAVTEDLGNRLKVFVAPQTVGTFQTLGTGVTPSGLVVADVNGDGKGDIVVANQDTGAPTIGVYLGNGDNTVETAQYATLGVAPVSVAVGDLDGDGQPDVVVADLAGGFKVLVQQHRTQLTVTAPTFAANEPAMVTVAVSAVGLVPTGNVTLSVDGGAALTAALVNGQATFNLGSLSSGSYSLAASYAAQNGFAASTGTGTLTIVAPRPTQLTVSAPAVTVNQSAIVTIGVASPGNPVPTGHVTLSVDGGAALTAALVSGEATFNLGSLSSGSHSLAASYAAQNGYLASTGSGTLTVNRLTSLLVLTQSPKVYRDEPPSLVANFGIGLGPGGTRPVQCYTDSSLTTPIPPPTNVGTYFATASFAGDATYAPTSLAQSFTIAQAATRIDLSIAATFPNTGLPVAPTGVVTFVDDTFGIFGVFIDVGTASFPPTFTYYLASDTGFANPLAGPPRDSGSYVVVASLAATANYQAATPQSAAFSIVGAPSLVVTTTADEDNGTSDPANGTGTSLREALKYAQNLGGARTITFAPGLAGQTVTLTAGWSSNGDASALAVSTAVTIQGLATSPGITLAIGAGVTRRHFYVAYGGALTLQNLTLTGGNAGGNNGGSIESDGDLDVAGCTFTGNIATRGGALFLSGPIVTYLTTLTRVANSTFAGNTSRLEGGAIFTSRGVMALSNVTIADNNSQSTSDILPGGGIFQQFNETRLVNCIIARNTPNDLKSEFSQVVDSFNNLIGVPAASLGLGALADNGGPTRTMALQPNSPALNAGATVPGLTTDQRGQGRPQFGAADIGAFELNAFDTGQATLSVGGAYWYLGPPAVGSDLRVYYLLPGQPEVWVDNGVGVRIGQALDGTVLVENSSGEVYARTGSTTGLGTAWPRLTSVVAGDGATWFFGPDGLGSDAYIYRWASGGAPTYSFGFGTQLSVAPNGAIFARNNAGNDYLRVGSDAGLGSSWQIVNRSLVSWRLLHGLPYDGTQDLANPAADGVANLLKYAFNMAPNIGDLAQVNLGLLPANGTAGLPFITPDPQGRLFIEFVRRKATTLPGIACIVETGDDLTALQPLSLTGATVVPIDATWERVTVTDPTLTPNRFGRVRVQIVP